MNIYIPKHIRKIGVVDKMCQLIQYYSSSPYAVSSNDSFSNYYSYLGIDPVIRFLHICIPRSDFYKDNKHSNEDYDSAIVYISRLFYSTKGTNKIFDYMQKYLNLEITEIRYTVKTLSFEIAEIDLFDIDENIYYDSLLDFLNALLYFGDGENLTIKIKKINLWLSNKLQNYIGERTITYKEYTTEEYGEI